MNGRQPRPFIFLAEESGVSGRQRSFDGLVPQITNSDAERQRAHERSGAYKKSPRYYFHLAMKRGLKQEAYPPVYWCGPEHQEKKGLCGGYADLGVRSRAPQIAIGLPITSMFLLPRRFDINRPGGQILTDCRSRMACRAVLDNPVGCRRGLFGWSQKSIYTLCGWVCARGVVPSRRPRVKRA